MSVPHTGKLVAIVRGLRVEFNGDAWQTPDADLTADLNAETERSSKTHYDIQERARRVLNALGLLKSSQIISVEFDAWKTAIPDDAED